MKKLLLILLTLTFPLLLWGQNYSNQYKGQQQYQDQVYDVEQYSEWKLSNPGGYNIPSFYWCITRSIYKFNGQYIFDVWFYSNSYVLDYYGNSVWTYTYVNNIYVIVNGQYINKEPVWVTFQNKFTYDGLKFYSINKFPRVRLMFDIQ